jgi:KaiC/GvpD/RAD55 family RecA-like ATPase
MGLHLGEENHVRREILKMSYILAHAGLTTILTTEIPEQEGKVAQFSRYGVEEFVSDGVVILSLLSLGTDTMRTISVRKMRGTKNDMNVHPFDITKDGISVKKKV